MSLPNTPAAKRIKLDLRVEVIVLVGPQEERFVVHKDVLVAKSRFFRAALEGQFREAKEKLIRLLEAGAEIFAIYLQWLYSGDIVLLDTHEIQSDEKGRKRKELLIKTYIMGDHLGSSLLQNQVLDQYIELLHSLSIGPNCANIERACDGLPETSMLRKFMLDWHLSKVKVDWLRSNIEMLPVEFTRHLTLGFAQAASNEKRPQSPHSKNKCDYHIHDDDAPPCLAVVGTK